MDMIISVRMIRLVEGEGENIAKSEGQALVPRSERDGYPETPFDCEWYRSIQELENSSLCPSVVGYQKIKY